MSIQVLDPGFQSMLVGAPAYGKRGQGIPWGGPADPVSMAISNALVGNAACAMALEICLVGPTLEALNDTAIACFGAPFRVKIDGKVASTANTHFLKKGQHISFLDCPKHTRAYLTVPGGFPNTPSPLKKKTILSCTPGRCGRRFLPPGCDFHPNPSVIRVTPGPEHSHFDANALEGKTFLVEQSSNRMGIRLSGNPLAVPAGEMLSEPVCPGTIQVARDGNLLVLGVDGQTIGGYPRVAQVIRADLHKLGQVCPGTGISFLYVSQGDAWKIWEEQEEKLRILCLRLSVASGDFL